MTKLATGNHLFNASIFLFLGALLLAPPTASAQDTQDTTECVGYHQTIISSTGLLISTCNWDLDDAPINLEAAGLTTDNSSHYVGCPIIFDIAEVPVKDSTKYGIKNFVCTVDDTPPHEVTQYNTRTKRNVTIHNFFGEIDVDFVNSSRDRVHMSIKKGKFKRTLNVSNLSDEDALECIADLEAYVFAVTGQNCPF